MCLFKCRISLTLTNVLFKVYFRFPVLISLNDATSFITVSLVYFVVFFFIYLISGLDPLLIFVMKKSNAYLVNLWYLFLQHLLHKHRKITDFVVEAVFVASDITDAVAAAAGVVINIRTWFGCWYEYCLSLNYVFFRFNGKWK